MQDGMKCAASPPSPFPRLYLPFRRPPPPPPNPSTGITSPTRSGPTPSSSPRGTTGRPPGASTRPAAAVRCRRMGRQRLRRSSMAGGRTSIERPAVLRGTGRAWLGARRGGTSAAGVGRCCCCCSRCRPMKGRKGRGGRRRLLPLGRLSTGAREGGRTAGGWRSRRRPVPVLVLGQSARGGRRRGTRRGRTSTSRACRSR